MPDQPDNFERAVADGRVHNTPDGRLVVYPPMPAAIAGRLGPGEEHNVLTQLATTRARAVCAEAERDQARAELAAANRDLDHTRRELEATRAAQDDYRQRLQATSAAANDHANTAHLLRTELADARTELEQQIQLNRQAEHGLDTARVDLEAARAQCRQLNREQDDARAEAADLRQQLAQIITDAGSHYEQLIIAARCASSDPDATADYWRWNGNAQTLRELTNEIARVAGIGPPDWERIKADVPVDGVYRRDSKPAASVPVARAPEPESDAELLGDLDRADRWMTASGIPTRGADVRAWLDAMGVPVPTGIHPLMHAVRRGVIAAGDAGYWYGQQTAAGAGLALLHAADRMRDHWAEATPDVRNRDLWQPLHQAADNLRELIESPETTAPPAVDHAGGPESPASRCPGADR